MRWMWKFFPPKTGGYIHLFAKVQIIMPSLKIPQTQMHLKVLRVKDEFLLRPYPEAHLQICLGSDPSLAEFFGPWKTTLNWADLFKRQHAWPLVKDVHHPMKVWKVVSTCFRMDIPQNPQESKCFFLKIWEGKLPIWHVWRSGMLLVTRGF